MMICTTAKLESLTLLGMKLVTHVSLIRIHEFPCLDESGVFGNVRLTKTQLRTSWIMYDMVPISPFFPQASTGYICTAWATMTYSYYIRWKLPTEIFRDSDDKNWLFLSSFWTCCLLRWKWSWDIWLIVPGSFRKHEGLRKRRRWWRNYNGLGVWNNGALCYNTCATMISTSPFIVGWTLQPWNEDKNMRPLLTPGIWMGAFLLFGASSVKCATSLFIAGLCLKIHVFDGK